LLPLNGKTNSLKLNSGDSYSFREPEFNFKEFMKEKLIKEEVVQDINTGLTLTKIAKKYNVALSTAFRAIKKFGLKPTKRRKHYLKDQTFERLIVLYEDNSKNNGSWICRCNCGKIVSVKADHLLCGHTRSCGCLAHDLKWTGYEEISGDYWNNTIKNAKARSLEFTIKIEDAWELFIKQNRECALSNMTINFDGSKRKKNQTASIDRIDSNKGYSIDNIQWVHKTIQKMKMDIIESEFIELCKRVANAKR